MDRIRLVIAFITGAVGTAALILACGNRGNTTVADASMVDAGGCSCPPSEPPLAGRLKLLESDYTYDGTGGGDLGLYCNDQVGGNVVHGQLLSGSCEDDVATEFSRVRTEYYSTVNGGAADEVRCVVGPSSSDNSTHTGHGYAFCLFPQG
jgi:hypothetical protein